MVRPDKVAVVAELRERLGQATATVLTEYRGLSVGELQVLRSRLRETDAEYKIVKNTLARRAAADAGFEVPDDLLLGPTAITFCAGDPVAAAKVLRAFSREHPQLLIKGGILEGNVLDATATLQLADLASREELLSQIAGMLGTLVAQPARLAQANLTKLAQLVEAYRAKREESGEQAPGGQPAAASGDGQAEGESPAAGEGEAAGESAAAGAQPADETAGA